MIGGPEMGKIRLTSWRAFWKAAAVLGAFAVWGGGPAYAISEVENFGVNVTVDNAFSLGSQGIEFGSISAVASVTDTAVLTLNGDNGATSVTNGANARIIVITNGEPGTVDVTGAPPNTTMSVGFTNSTITLTHVFDTNAATFTANLVAFVAATIT